MSQILLSNSVMSVAKCFKGKRRKSYIIVIVSMLETLVREK